MFKLFTHPKKGEQLSLQLSGLHCTSCSLTIDGELEDTVGVFRAKTNYAKQTTIINYDPNQTNPTKLQDIITSLGYEVVK